MEKLMSFKEALKATKAKIEEVMIPLKVKQNKAQGEIEKLKLDESIMTLEVEIRELTVTSPIDFGKLLDKVDEIELLQRRRTLFDRVMTELFEE